MEEIQENNEEDAKALHRLIAIDYIAKQAIEYMIIARNMEVLAEYIQLTDEELTSVEDRIMKYMNEQYGR